MGLSLGTSFRIGLVIRLRAVGRDSDQQQEGRRARASTSLSEAVLFRSRAWLGLGLTGAEGGARRRRFHTPHGGTDYVRRIIVSSPRSGSTEACPIPPPFETYARLGLSPF